MKAMPMLAAVVVAAAAAVAQPSFARAPRHQNYSQAPEESALVEHGHYINRQGHDVQSPAHSKDGSVPNGATAKCRDGSYSFSESHRGTCSRHGGVAGWL
ncbi:MULTISPECIES: DUF3761 domain-containing protein [Ralstonia]|mgnify:CR=1 FL=1|jgi:Tfp pilus assembly protein PilE|uniref:DUF3761 domain-containing protein n=1 Tax=Ralstonia pickettii OR214 TaxID=1264675 RepID=R0CPQ9_RALPI|nr:MULTISPECIES: DUF3761 domain-containing protein [Ralstonia]MEA3270085.1 DUF3761 domain-containing protein [Pseudomonadota bacterium]ENZ78611.1 hypothetical protein OR214_01124 [Ralstonia pickettii OR214]MBL4780191.1 DUF3761 domain-containing protein [Ralstonia sp.]MCM3581518.1 DUF3761 domain-containing protein [Ralstonia pickettii]MDR9386129.1 DUF3761 domain-containing protein [Ralstonia sp. 11b]